MNDHLEALSDAQLAAMAAAGDALAFRRLYYRHVERVFALVGRVLGPHRQEQEDVVQDVFVEVHRALPRFRGEAAFTTWLHRVAINVTIGRLRQRPLATTDLLSDELPSSQAPAESTADARAAVRRLYAQLESVSAGNRVVFTLYEFDGRTLDEIAAALDMPISTVAARLRRTREALLSALRPAESARLAGAREWFQ